jgi:heme exporter protein B
VLIFGVGSDVAGAFRLLAAASLVALAVSPFAAAAALRPE